MDLPATLELLHNIERRQDEVLRGLDELDVNVEHAIREAQSQVRIFRPIDSDAA